MRFSKLLLLALLWFTPASAQLATTGAGSVGAAAGLPNFNNFTGSNLAQFVTASAAVAAQTRNGTIMAVGDSTTAGFVVGVGSNWYPLSWPVQLAALQGYATDSMMDNISGPTANFAALKTWDSRVTGTSANYAGSGNQSLSGQLWVPVSTTDPFIFTPANPIDTVEVRTAAFSGGSASPFLVNFDGGTNTVISNINATAILRTTILTTTLGSHSINLSTAVPANNSTQQFNSFVAYNSAVKKFNMLNCGLNGALVANFNSTAAAWNTLKVIQNWPPDLVIIMIGINDWVNSTVLATYTTNLNLIINAAKNGGSSVIVMSPPPSNSTVKSYAFQATYVAAMKAAAIAASVPFIDIWNLCGGTWNTGCPMSDNLHPTAPGYVQIAGYVQTALAPGFVSP